MSAFNQLEDMIIMVARALCLSEYASKRLIRRDAPGVSIKLDTDYTKKVTLIYEEPILKKEGLILSSLAPLPWRIYYILYNKIVNHFLSGFH